METRRRTRSRTRTSGAESSTKASPAKRSRSPSPSKRKSTTKSPATTKPKAKTPAKSKSSKGPKTPKKAEEEKGKGSQDVSAVLDDVHSEGNLLGGLALYFWLFVVMGIRWEILRYSWFRNTPEGLAFAVTSLFFSAVAMIGGKELFKNPFEAMGNLMANIVMIIMIGGGLYLYISYICANGDQWNCSDKNVEPIDWEKLNELLGRN